MFRCFGFFFLVFGLARANEPASLHIPLSQEGPSLAVFVGMEPAPGWRDRFLRIENFIQSEPRDGQPASMPTRIFLTQTRTSLFIAVAAYDQEPDKLRANMSFREEIGDDDRVTVLLDTFHDRRRAYAFGVNGMGIQWDALYSEGEGYDTSFQAVWRTHARRTEQGFLALMAIPFKSLRFPQRADQRWGVLVRREIPRLNEENWWPRVSSGIEGILNQAAVVGLRTEAKAGSLQLAPFGFSRGFRALDRNRNGGPGFVEDDFDGDAGLDAKWVIRDGLVLDATVNPDFSQVESDQPQVTVNQRFEVFFPERRPFFLENADLFQTPINLVFTRRIVDPSAGLRLSGKKGRYALGTMLVDDRATEQVLNAEEGLPMGQRATIGVIRVTRDIAKQSKLGLLVTDRELGEGYQRVAGVDGRFKWDDHWVGRFQAASSWDKEPGKDVSRAAAYDVRVIRSGLHWNQWWIYERTEAEFGSDLGFFSGDKRPDSQTFRNITSYQFRPGGKLTDWGLFLFTRQLWNTGGERQDWSFNPDIWFNWLGNTGFDFEYDASHERLSPAEFPALAGPVDYSKRRWSLGTDWGSLRTFRTSLDIDWGTTINFVPPAGQAPVLADWVFFRTGFTFRPITALRVDTNFLFNELRDRDGAGRIFENRILRSKWNWQFTKELSLRLIYQEEETVVNPALTRLSHNRNRNVDLLLRYVLNPWSAVYLGYNDNRSNLRVLEEPSGNLLIRADGLANTGRQWFLKVSYLFQH